MNDGPPFSAERLGDENTWRIFVDDEEDEVTRAFVLYSAPAQVGHSNTQIILASLNQDDTELDDELVFDDEIYTTFLYSHPDHPEHLDDLLCEMVSYLQNALIDTPFELVHAFGGTVRGRSAHSMPDPYSH